MLTVTYAQLRDQSFARAMSKVVNYSGFKNPKVAYSIAKLNKKMMEESQLADELFQKLVKNYSLLDEKGEFVPNNGVAGTFQIRPEVQKDWEEKYKEFLDMKVELSHPAIALKELADCQLSPLELGALENFVVELEAV